MVSHPPSLRSSLDRTLCPKRLLRHQLVCRNSWQLIQPTECHAHLGWKVLHLRLPSAKNRRRPLLGRCLVMIQKYLTHFGLQPRIHQPFVTARSRQHVNTFHHFLSITATAPCMSRLRTCVTRLLLTTTRNAHLLSSERNVPSATHQLRPVSGWLHPFHPFPAILSESERSIRAA